MKTRLVLKKRKKERKKNKKAQEKKKKLGKRLGRTKREFYFRSGIDFLFLRMHSWTLFFFSVFFSISA